MSNAIPKPSPPSRPQRRSSFAPVGDKTQNANAQVATPPSGHTAPGDTAQKPRPANARNVILALPDEEKQRMVNTIDWTSQHTSIRHQTRFIRWAIAKACAELEQQYNSGEPFPPPDNSADI